MPNMSEQRSRPASRMALVTAAYVSKRSAIWLMVLMPRISSRRGTLCPSFRFFFLVPEATGAVAAAAAAPVWSPNVFVSLSVIASVEAPEVSKKVSASKLAVEFAAEASLLTEVVEVPENVAALLFEAILMSVRQSFLLRGENSMGVSSCQMTILKFSKILLVRGACL